MLLLYTYILLSICGNIYLSVLDLIHLIYNKEKVEPVCYDSEDFSKHVNGLLKCSHLEASCWVKYGPEE